MAPVYKISSKPNPYDKLTLGKDNHTVVTEVVQRVGAVKDARMADVPIPLHFRTAIKQEQEELNAIMADLRKMSDALDESKSTFQQDQGFHIALRHFIRSFNAAYSLLMELDQQMKTNHSDQVILQLREHEALLRSHGILIDHNDYLALHWQIKTHEENVKMVQDLFADGKIFSNLCQFFKLVLEGAVVTSTRKETKLQGLIIDRRL